MARRGLPPHRTADGAQPVGHIDVPVPALCLFHVETGPIVAHREKEPTRLFPQPHFHVRVDGVLGCVLQRLQTAEVDGGFGL